MLTHRSSANGGDLRATGLYEFKAWSQTVNVRISVGNTVFTTAYSQTLLLFCHTLFIYFVCAVRNLPAVVNLSSLRQPDLGAV